MSRYKFEIPDHKVPEFEAWLGEQDRLAAESMKDDDEIHGYPPSATGECVVFEFMPTSMGPCVKARHLYTKNEIDLSDEI